MYILFLIFLILANIELIRRNKNLVIKSYLPRSYKIILIITFLIMIWITRYFAKDKLANTYPLLIFLWLYNSLQGGLSKEGIEVFDGTTIFARTKIPYKDINHPSFYVDKGYLILQISAYADIYKQNFLLDDEKNIIKILKDNHINPDKKK